MQGAILEELSAQMHPRALGATGSVVWIGKGTSLTPPFPPFSLSSPSFIDALAYPADFHVSWSWWFPGPVPVPRASEPMQVHTATKAHSSIHSIAQHELRVVLSRSWTWETIFWCLLVEKKRLMWNPTVVSAMYKISSNDRGGREESWELGEGRAPANSQVSVLFIQSSDSKGKIITLYPWMAGAGINRWGGCKSLAKKALIKKKKK